ncbi:Craniofacial development protein 2, partial [Varanus komodoensis]
MDKYEIIKKIGEGSFGKVFLAKGKEDYQQCVIKEINLTKNQGKLDVVKQEMTRLNIDILGISELKWTGMGEFNSDDHQVYYAGKNPSEEME